MTTPKAAGAISGERQKAEIFLFDGNLPEAVDAIEAVLVERGAEIFQRDGALYVNSSNGAVRATAALMRFHAMRVIDFYRTVLQPRAHIKQVDPPLKYFVALLRKGEWKFPLLDDGDMRSSR